MNLAVKTKQVGEGKKMTRREGQTRRDKLQPERKRGLEKRV